MAPLGPIGLPGGPPTPIPTKPLGPEQKSILSVHGGPLAPCFCSRGISGSHSFFHKTYFLGTLEFPSSGH